MAQGCLSTPTYEIVVGSMVYPSPNPDVTLNAIVGRFYDGRLAVIHEVTDIQGVNTLGEIHVEYNLSAQDLRVFYGVYARGEAVSDELTLKDAINALLDN